MQRCAFSRWCAYAHKWQEREARAAQDINRRSLEHLDHEIKDCEERLKQKTHELDTSEQRLRYTYHCYCQALFTRLVSTLVSKLTRRHFSKWRIALAAAQERKKALANQVRMSIKTLMRILKRALDQTIGLALNTWKLGVQEKRRRECLITRLVCRMQHCVVRSSYSSWQRTTRTGNDHDRERTSKRLTLQRIVSKMRHIGTSSAFQRWQSTVSDLREAHTVQLFHAQRQKDRMRVVIQRIERGLLWRGLCKWKDLWKLLQVQDHATREQQRRLRSVALRMQHGLLGKSVSKWLSFRNAQRRQEQGIKQVVQRMQKGQLWKGFRRWVRWWGDLQEGTYKLVRIRRVMLKLHNVLIAKALRSWVVHTEQHRCRERNMRKVILHMSHGIVRKGWAKWTNVVAFWRNEEDVRQQQTRVMRKVILKMTHAQTASALWAWFAFVDNQVRCQTIMTRAVLRMIKMSIAKGWKKWLNVTLYPRNAREQPPSAHKVMMRTVILRMTKTISSRSFRAWVCFVVDSKHCEKLMHNVICRTVRGSLYKGLPCCML